MKNIFLIFCFSFLAVTAFSQKPIKGTGFCYFSSDAFTTVFVPNILEDCEIAYTVDKQEIYCWNRNTTAWQLCADDSGGGTTDFEVGVDVTKISGGSLGVPSCADGVTYFVNDSTDCYNAFYVYDCDAANWELVEYDSIYSTRTFTSMINDSAFVISENRCFGNDTLFMCELNCEAPIVTVSANSPTDIGFNIEFGVYDEYNVSVELTSGTVAGNQVVEVGVSLIDDLILINSGLTGCVQNWNGTTLEVSGCSKNVPNPFPDTLLAFPVKVTSWAANQKCFNKGVGCDTVQTYIYNLADNTSWNHDEIPDITLPNDLLRTTPRTIGGMIWANNYDAMNPDPNATQCGDGMPWNFNSPFPIPSNSFNGQDFRIVEIKTDERFWYPPTATTYNFGTADYFAMRDAMQAAIGSRTNVGAAWGGSPIGLPNTIDKCGGYWIANDWSPNIEVIDYVIFEVLSGVPNGMVYKIQFTKWTL